MKWLVLIGFLLLGWLQYQLWFVNVHDIQQLKAAIAAQQSRNHELEQRNQILFAEVKELKTGLDAVEERARNELGMIKPNETFVRIIEDETR